MSMITNEQAHAIAQVAIELEQAKQAVLTQQRNRRTFYDEHYEDGESDVVHGHLVYYPGAGWDTPENEAAHMASYDVEAVLIKERNRKRRLYQKAVRAATPSQDES